MPYDMVYCLWKRVLLAMPYDMVLLLLLLLLLLAFL
jgi:hypothetical protein